jgi:O-antigen ligase
MIISFFSSAAIAGVFGIYQYFKWESGNRAMGFSDNPLHYAGLLAFVCIAAVIMLFIRNKNVFESKRGILFLSIVATLTFFGILFSLSRGVWVAIVAACLITLFLYDNRKAFIFSFFIMFILVITLSMSNDLRQRAFTIITSLFEENETGSTGIRLELWKASLIIFKESPLLGIGTENFDTSVKRLGQENKIKKMLPLPYVHAHNIFFQALATRGAVGFITTLGLFIALIKWGTEEIRNNGNVGGYIIILSTTFTIISGLTENNIEFTKFLAAYCFTIGLLGSLGTLQGNPVKNIEHSKRNS